MPAKQLVHAEELVAFMVDEKLPAEQFVHEDADKLLNVPGGQLRHYVAP